MTVFLQQLAFPIVMLACLLAGCDGGDHALYEGTLQPSGGTCDPPASATLEIRNDSVLFVPRDGTIILHGSREAGGALHAEATLPGMDHKPYRLVFSAPSAQLGVVEGRYITPRCAYVIMLKKTQK